MAQSDEYVLRCYRYIELNPERARIVRHPRGYQWSSYGANGEERADPVLAPHAEYLGLGTSGDTRRSAYRALIKGEMDDAHVQAIRHATNGNYVLGDPRFQREIAQMLKRRVTPGHSGRPKRDD